MKQRGFTLVEVLIVIAIIAVIIFIAAPLSGGWLRDANLLTAEAQLTEAIGRAKAASLRNSSAATGDNPVTAVCRSNGNLLTVREGTAAAAPSCSTPAGTQVWQAQIDTKVTVQVSGSTLSCLCFANKGQTTTSGTCSSCAASTSFTLSATGTDSVTVAIF